MSESAAHEMPPEILGEIFIRCVPQGPGALYNDLTWIAPSQVCQQWRQEAIGCHQLWARGIILSNPFWTFTALRRAANAPLTFDIDLQKTDMHLAVTLVGVRVAQMRALFVSGTSSQLREFLPYFAQEAAPLLEVLRLELRDRGTHNEDDNFIPDVFAKRGQTCAPSLHTVELVGCYLPMGSALYKGIASVALRDPPTTQSEWTLANILKTMPQLQSLTVEDLGKPFIPPQIFLNHSGLTNLTFSCYKQHLSRSEADALYVLLSTVKLSSTWNITGRVHDLDHLYTCIRLLRARMVNQPLEMDIGQVETDDGAEELHLRVCTVGWPRKSLELRVSTATSIISRLAVMRYVVGLFDRYDVASFATRGYHIVANGIDVKDVWQGYMYFPRAVTCWNINTQPPPLLLEAILIRRMLSIGINTGYYKHNEIQRDSHGNTIQIFPDLQSIRIVDIDLSVALVGLYASKPTARPPQSVLQLVLMIVWACAERRRLKIAGSYIPGVVIDGCEGVDAGVVSALRRLTSVRWDGKGSTSWTDYEDIRTFVISEYVEMFKIPDKMSM